MAAGAHKPFGMHIAYAKRLGFEERVRLLREAGFEATTLWWDTRDSRHARLRDLAPGIIREHGLEIDHFHVPYRRCNDLWSPEPVVRAAAVEQHRAWLKDCARHEVRVMVMHAVQGNARGIVQDAGLASFGELSSTAECLGVTLALENTRRPDLMDLLLDAIPDRHLALCYDCSHDWLYSDSPLAMLRRWGDRVAAVHLSDTDGRRDHHWLPGEGEIDFAALGEAFPAGQFPGALMLECVARDRSQPPQEFLAAAHARLSEYAPLLTGGAGR